MLSIGKNLYSHLTVKEREYASFPVREILQQGLIKGNVLDFGCGLGKDVEFLQLKGFDVSGYDPHYQPEYPQGRFDTILCNYVLNVLLPEEQSLVLMQISELLKPTGRAYITVRRDVQKSGFIFNPKRNATVYQCRVVLPYRSLLRTRHCEIYEYQHFNYEQPKFAQELITECATAYAVYKDESLTEALILSKRRQKNYFELTLKEQFAMWMVVNRVQQILNARLAPHDFEIRFHCSYEKPLPYAGIHVSPVLFPVLVNGSL